MKTLLFILCGCLVGGTIPARGSDAGASETAERAVQTTVQAVVRTGVSARCTNAGQAEDAGRIGAAGRNEAAADTPAAERADTPADGSVESAAGTAGRNGSQRRPQSRPQSGTAQGPLLTIDDPVHDFGDVARKGGDVAHDFVFRNAGDKPLVILRVITSC